MAQAAKKLKASPEADSRQLELIPSNSHNPFWESSLFNEVYLQNDVPQKYKDLWELDEAGPFYQFCNSFRNLCEELKDSDFNSWSERNTINRLIKPVLKMLGYEGTATQEPWAEDEPFSVTEGGELRTYKPDFIVVSDPKELKYIERKKGDEKLAEARASVIVPIEAKYWGRIEDTRRKALEDQKRADKKDQADSARGLSFDEQCLKYMEILGKDFGILTDGKTWRIYNRELSADSYRRNYQFNLGHLIRHVNAGLDRDSRDYEVFIENAKYFFHFFSKAAFHSESGDRRFLDDLLEYSKKYVGRAEENLKSRFINAMTVACNGLLRSAEKQKDTSDLNLIRNIAETHLFNILFIKYCEARGILPIKQSPEYRMASVSNVIDKLEYFDPDKDEDGLNFPLLKRMFSKDFPFDPNGEELYDRLLKLTKVVQNGTSKEYPGFNIDGFKESVFSKDEWSYAQSHKLSNSEMIRIFFELGYAESDVKGKKYQQIPYNFFSPRQLGSIYESFLEFRLDRAETDLAFLDGQWVKANLGSEKVRGLDVPKVRRGNVFFTPDNKDRKVSGSYYTPDYVVQKLVFESLMPSIRGKKSNDLLKLRICDPAMGSGHFLSAALNLLTKAYLETLENEVADDVNHNVPEAKRLVLKHCIYGADINARAVKLAKMSLWLESACPNGPLEGLDDQLICVDSLRKDLNSEFKKLSSSFKSLDVIVGNPPWGAHLTEDDIREMNKRYPEASYKLNDTFKYFIVKSLKSVRGDGYVGLVVPRSLLTHIGCRDVRQMLLEHSVTQIYDLGDHVFEGVVCPSCMFVVRNSNRVDADQITFFDASAEELGTDRLLRAQAMEVDQEVYLKNENREFSLGSVETDRFKALGFKSLKELADIFDSGLDYSRKALGDAVFYDGQKPEAKGDHKVLRGRNINRFELSFSGIWLRSEWKEIESKQKKKDPKTRLKVNEKAYLDTPKIFVRQTADEIIAMIDTNKHYNQKSLLSIHPKDKKSTYYLLGVLNSDVMTAQYRKLVQEEGQVFSQVKKNKLEQLMVPYGIDAAIEKRISTCAEKLAELNDSEDSRFKKLFSELNESVNELFSNKAKRRKSA